MASTGFRHSVEFELQALLVLADSLFPRGRDPQQVKWRLGAVTPEGLPVTDQYLGLPTIYSGEARLQEKLRGIFPAAFFIAFKIHDLAVEWLLRQSNAGVPERFTEKVKEWKRLAAHGRLQLPPLLSRDQDIAHDFGSLYELLHGSRGTASHQGGLHVDADGTLHIPPNASRKHVPGMDIRSEQLAAYVHFCCLLAQQIDGHAKAIDIAWIKMELAELAGLHDARVTSIVAPRWVTLEMQIDPEKLVGTSPLQCEIDFDLARRACEPAGEREVFFESLHIQVDLPNRSLRWRLEHDDVPHGVRLLTEDDAWWQQKATEPVSPFDDMSPEELEMFQKVLSERAKARSR